MAVFNYLRKEIDAKIVYYGPAVCGKTTNLQYIHQHLKPEQRGKMVSLATNEDRTLFFDFLPVELESVRGFKTRFHLYTVPGQAYYGATRRAVLTGADGVVFVADSQTEKMEENLFSLKDMEENLRYYGKKIETIPMVIQYNKRDLSNILSVEELDQKINRFNVPFFESVAITGQGVRETLTMACKLVLRAIEAGVEARRTAAVSEAVSEPAPEKVPRMGRGLPRVEAPKAQPEKVSEPAPENVSRIGRGLPRVEAPKGQPEKVSEPAPERTPRLGRGFPRVDPQKVQPEATQRKVLRIEKEEAPPGPVPSVAEAASAQTVSAAGGHTSTEGVPPSFGGRPGGLPRLERKVPPLESPRPTAERVGAGGLRLETSTSAAENSHPAMNVMLGRTLRGEKPAPSLKTPLPGSDGMTARMMPEERETVPQEMPHPTTERKPEEIGAPEKAGITLQTPTATSAEVSPGAKETSAPMSEMRRAETRSFLGRMFERKKGESGSKLEEAAVLENAKEAVPIDRMRIISCGEPRILPPAGLEIPVLVKIDGQERSFSFHLKIQFDPSGISAD